jgi:hypothetical protein
MFPNNPTCSAQRDNRTLRLGERDLVVLFNNPIPNGLPINMVMRAHLTLRWIGFWNPMYFRSVSDSGEGSVGEYRIHQTRQMLDNNDAGSLESDEVKYPRYTR